MTDCTYGSKTCPCQDGDPCHYEGENPMTPSIVYLWFKNTYGIEDPEEFVRAADSLKPLAVGYVALMNDGVAEEDEMRGPMNDVDEYVKARGKAGS